MTTPEAAKMIAFDLDGLAVPGEDGMCMKALADTGAARVVLVVLRADHDLPEQVAPSQLVVQALRGQASLHAGTATRLLTPGTLVLLEEHVPHRLRALTDTVLLFTYTPSPPIAGEDTTLFAALPAYVRRQPPLRPRSRPPRSPASPRRHLPVVPTHPR
jgi:quercetin dioxygenase-like cupin family protein